MILFMITVDYPMIIDEFLIHRIPNLSQSLIQILGQPTLLPVSLEVSRIWKQGSRRG